MCKMWSKVIILGIIGCTNSYTTSLDLGGVISGNRMGGVPLGRSLGNGELDVEGVCETPGMTCLNCTHAVTCIPLPRGWLRVPLQECPPGQSCNAREGRCSEYTVPECDAFGQKYQHICEQVGIFPDAWDCRKFHLCSPLQDAPSSTPAEHRVALCPRNYGYDPRIAQCSVKLYKGQCQTKPVPDCLRLGQMGSLPSSPNHYYVCNMAYKQLYPQIFICPHGWFYFEGFCRPREEISTEITTAVLESTTPEVPTTKKYKPSKIEMFFSTEKASTFPPDAFLADKFDLTNYESTDDVAPSNDDFANSFENGYDFW